MPAARTNHLRYDNSSLDVKTFHISATQVDAAEPPFGVNTTRQPSACRQPLRAVALDGSAESRCRMVDGNSIPPSDSQFRAKHGLILHGPSQPLYSQCPYAGHRRQLDSGEV